MHSTRNKFAVNRVSRSFQTFGHLSILRFLAAKTEEPLWSFYKKTVSLSWFMFLGYCYDLEQVKTLRLVQEI